MFKFIFFSFLAGLFGWGYYRPPVYVHNDVNVDVDGDETYVSNDCDYGDETYVSNDGGDSSGE